VPLVPGSVVASGESGETLLRVQGLGKRFGRHVVLEDVELTVKAGQLVALVGENGAGKSTLVRCVAGDLSADSVTVEPACSEGADQRQPPCSARSSLARS